MPCALPPLDQTEVAIGRGYGLGYNRERTSADQLHAGMDFVASSGTPVLAPIPGVVDFVTANEGPRINADSARGGSVGQVRRMGGYGNAVVLRHDLVVPGMPTPFYTSYNHLSRVAPGVAPGLAVGTGTLLGQVGQTTNGQFPGMGAHLHMEVRRVPFPGSYERDTMDPSLLFAALGIDWIDFRREVGRGVGGRLLIRADGPSGPAACPSTAGAVAGLGIAIPVGVQARVSRRRIAIPYIPGIGIPGVPFLGLGALDAYMCELGEGALGLAPAGYVDPERIKPKYARFGTTQVPRPGSPAADVMPPDYTLVVEGGLAPVTGTVSGLAIGGGIAIVIGIAAWMKGRK